MCPVCRAPLRLNEKQWQCDNRHSYDKSKAGYVNLLLANQKNSHDPGDSKDMVNGRRVFLEGGNYYPLIQRLVDLIKSHADSNTLSVYDAGCGEGYYLSQIVPMLIASNLSIKGCGHDVSRAAIEKAAKKHSSYNFAIGNSFEMPVVTASQDVLLQVFAPMKDSEARRVLKSNGIWLRVSPAPGHLSQIKDAIYQKPKAHELSDTIPEGFIELEKSHLLFNFNLDKASDRKALLMMTPYYWRAKEKEVSVIVDDLTEFSAAFSVSVFKKS
ncbi:MAG: putative RNA methyltransferase [Pseudohongiellaceae bacterium]